MSNEICTDNRFEVIKYCKEKLIQSTNIETSPDEMAVLDNILFRFWQMGWLDCPLKTEGKDCKGNTGKCNTGRGNTGDYNSGNWNRGSDNSGYRNAGNYNSGDYNSGNYNSGRYNNGHWNSGHYNSGDRNTGNYNRGDSNTGDFNKTNYSNGCFNTEEPRIYFFNKPSEWTYHDWAYSPVRYLLAEISNALDYVYFTNMTGAEKKEHPEAEITGGYLKKLDNSEHNNQAWWHGLTNLEKEMIKAIPNFDKEIFKKITGIDVDCNYDEIGEEQ